MVKKRPWVLPARGLYISKFYNWLLSVGRPGFAALPPPVLKFCLSLYAQSFHILPLLPLQILIANRLQMSRCFYEF